MDLHVKTTASEGRFTGQDGLSIAYRAWSAVATPRGVLVIVPGFNSHSGYYGWVGSKVAGGGFAVYAIDLRGRGKSDGERYYVDSFFDYADDVGGLVSLAITANPGLPVYLLGHSAGGVVACLYALDHQAQLAGLICESFAFQVPAPDFAIAALKGLSHLAPHAHVLKLANKDFSRDPAVVAAMDADPLIANETQPTKTVAEMARTDDRLKQSFGQVVLPLLILHGTHDHATRPSGSQFFHDHAGSKDKTLKLYDGHVHDLLNDIGREQVLEDITSWIDARLG